jgi:hypothetical protein
MEEVPMFLIEFKSATGRTFSSACYATREDARQYIRDMRVWEQGLPKRVRTRARVVGFETVGRVPLRRSVLSDL